MWSADKLYTYCWKHYEGNLNEDRVLYQSLKEEVHNEEQRSLWTWYAATFVIDHYPNCKYNQDRKNMQASEKYIYNYIRPGLFMKWLTVNLNNYYIIFGGRNSK